MSVLLENEGYHGDRDLVDIPESGEPIYDDKVSSNSLLEEQLNESKAVDNQSEPEEEPQADESLSVNDVLKLKQSVLTNLGDAQNELAVALDVVNLLLSNTPRHENEEMQLPVPKHSIGASAIDSAEPTPAQALRKSKIAITTKNESLQSAANIFDRASEQTDQVNKQNLRFWEDCLLLRDRNWTLIPSNGKTDPATDLERSAKDIKVLYAVEEASNEIKHESIASFDIKPSPSSSSTLNTGKRRSKRLKVSIRRGNSVETSSAGCSSDAATSASAAGDGNESLLRSLNDAQDASFDEDLFASLLTESNHIPIVITSSAELIAIELDTHTQLVLELLSDCDPKEGEQQSKHCDILLLGIKLLHLKNYEKKSATTKQALKQLLDLLHYDAFTKSIESLLRRTTALLSYMEVREADCCIQRTHAREILDIFVHHKSLQNITSQGFVRYGKQ
ncbi:hypothetical protein E3P99_02143 [Wallemia hederae]|uniref:Mediator of RNA polymerase II transcription subunit 17 n=1 Tax=Wallemia hederae TaxID=1540922 RepID=A0A4T0FLZ7_9BASI|nr:hypothetical protein E3P99_02143 [Wallemia hederae]